MPGRCGPSERRPGTRRATGRSAIIPDNTLDLIGRIYETVLDPSRLPSVLRAIGESVGGVQECLLAQVPGEHAVTTLAPRRDPAYARSLRDDWPYRDDDGFDVLIDGLRACPVGRAVDMRLFVDARRLAGTGFYHDWWRAQGLGDASLMVRFTAGNGGWGLFGVHRSRRRGDEFSRDEAALLDTLAPHLARSASVQHELACLAFERQARVPRDAAGKGVYLLDAAGRVVLANAVAEGWLERGDWFRLEHGRLSLDNPDAAGALAHLVTHCARLSIHDGAPGGSLALPPPHGSAELLHIEAMPFRSGAAGADVGWLALFDPAAVLVVTDRNAERRQRKSALRERFGLTPVESELALELLRGAGREAVGERMGISPATVRTHLTRIFDKTGVRRQAELVRLLSGTGEPSLY